jgi:FkbM family methyltransferase
LKKVFTYSRYLKEYLKFGDFKSVFASVKYILFRTSHPDDRMINTSIGRFHCRKNTNDFQFANLYYEWGVKKFILKHIDQFSVFIDIGACIGDYSIMLAKMNKKCHAFELIPGNFDALRRNIELNCLRDRIKSYPCGLGMVNYRTNYTFNPVNTGASKVDENSVQGYEAVEIRTLDSFIDTMEIDPKERVLVKIDVEGMEADVIRGARNFIHIHENITFIVEDKHCGDFAIRDAFREAGSFEFGRVDNMNLYAKKINFTSKNLSVID